MRYTWEHHSGGVLLTDTLTGETIFLQPGDDSGKFLADVERIEAGEYARWSVRDEIEQYFG